MLAGAMTIAAAVAFGGPSAASALSFGQIGAQMRAKQAQATKVRAQLDASRADLAKKLAEYFALNKRLDATRREIGGLTQRLGTLEARLAAERAKLGDVAVERYEGGQSAPWEMLFGARTMEEFVAVLDYLGYVGGRDAQVIDGVQATHRQTAKVRTAVRAREQRIVALRHDVDAQRVKIMVAVDRQQTALNSVTKDIANLVMQQERAVEAARAAAAAAEAAGGGTVDVPVGGASWMTAASLVPGAHASVDGLSGRYLIPSGQPTRYQSTGLAFDWGCSTYGNADNSPPNSTASASSRPFHETELTCANKILPFGTLLAVSYGGR